MSQITCQFINSKFKLIKFCSFSLKINYFFKSINIVKFLKKCSNINFDSDYIYNNNNIPSEISYMKFIEDKMYINLIIISINNYRGLRIFSSKKIKSKIRRTC